MTPPHDAPHELALRILNARARVRAVLADDARRALATNDASRLAELLVMLCDELGVQLVVKGPPL